MLLRRICLSVVVLGSVGTGFAACTGHASLNSYERGQFIEVANQERDEVVAQYLSELGCRAQMLDGLRSLGATVRYADVRSGYALVTIARDKLLDTLDIEGIEYAFTRNDDRMYYQDPVAKVPQDQRKPEPVPQIAIPYPHVATTLTINSTGSRSPDAPYFEADAIGLTKLWREHPDADGRGVRVAVPDEGFDLLHPALQEARDAAGKIVPKVADLGTLTVPDEDSGWVRFGDPIQTAHGALEAAGRTWTAPQDGTYRFGIFQQKLFLGPEYNSHTKKLALSVGVLWDQLSRRVWVDTDGDGSFRDERPLGDYGLTHEIAWFGTKFGAKEGDDDNRIPFGVKIDAVQNAVYIRIGGEHGALVAGPLAGNELSGGLFNGASPGAQLIDENLTRATLISGMVAAFARPDVDVVNRSGGIGRAEYTGLREGVEDFAQRVLERLVAVYDKPIAAFSAATGTIHVNDYAGPEMLRRNRQLAPPYKETIHSSVWWLPNGLVNTVLAPSANLETQSRYEPLDLAWPDGRRHSFSDNSFNPPAPQGYVIGANNSPAIPVVSGVLADLISEAKRAHVRYDATRLNNAVFTGARLLDGIAVSQQGYGLVDAARSWEQLSKMAQADDPKNPQLTSFTLSRLEAGHSIEVQGFHADLPKAGDKLESEIWITRHGGYSGGRRYTFALRGNDGSYELGDHDAVFMRDKPLRIRFRDNGAPGWHLVFLELRDAKADVVMEDVPLSVRVPDLPKSAAPGIDEYQSTIQPLTSEYRYIRVGATVQAARYIMHIPFTGPCCSTRWFPGSHYREGGQPAGEPVDASHNVGPLETIESLVANDEPGTQEIFWENRGRPEYATQYDGPAPDAPIHADLTVSKYTVAIQKNSEDALTIMNKLAEIEGKVELYDATLKTAPLTGTGLHASGELERTLPANLEQWRVQVASDSASSEPEDFYLLNCSGKNGCHLAAEQEISAPGKTIAIDKPQAGEWKVVVRSRDQVQHPVASYTLREAFLIPASAPIDPADSQHASGTTWTLPLPRKASDAQYAAFRIAGTPGNKREKDGLRIALTPLDADAP